MVHPLIRIASVAALALALVGRAPAALAGLLCVVLAANALHGAATLVRFVRLSRRVAWLLAAVLVLNAIATPGAPLWEQAPAWLPSSAGLLLAATRVGVILIMLAAVNLLLATSTRAELIAGIAGALRPLAALGVDPARISVRTSLALENLANSEGALRRGAARAGWAEAAADAVRAIEADAQAATPVALPPASAPPVAEWSLPVALLALRPLCGMFGI